MKKLHSRDIWRTVILPVQALGSDVDSIISDHIVIPDEEEFFGKWLDIYLVLTDLILKEPEQE